MSFCKVLLLLLIDILSFAKGRRKGIWAYTRLPQKSLAALRFF